MSAVDILLLLNACTHFANAKHGTAWHDTAQHRTARHGISQYGTARHCTAQHGTARPLSTYCSCASAANFFLEKLCFSRTKVVPIYGFLFLNTINLQLCVTRLQTHVLHSVTLPYVLSNERVSLSYGGVINILCNLDLPDTNFLKKYLLNLHRAMCSTTQNRLGSMLQCSKFSIK
jgi:hypothetical protein